MNHDRHWCEGCKRQFPLKRLKKCAACRISTYCSAECQAAGWKDGHKNICREIVVQGNLLKGWGNVWSLFLRWMTVRALNLTNRPENRYNRCFEIYLKKTGSNDLHRAYEVLDGRVEPLYVNGVQFEPGSNAEEDPNDQLYVALIVMGEEDEIIDFVGLCWNFPTSIHDTPARSEFWAECCVDIMQSAILYGRPRQAIREATLAMETALLKNGVFELCSVDALYGRG